MNKKRLSVVMAGAMLASSVAPVLAETTTSEISANDLGLLIGKIREKLTSATFANETTEDIRRNGAKAGKSIYFVAVDGVKIALDESSTQTQYQQLLGDLKVGQKVEIWKYASVEENGKYYINKETNEVFDEDSLNTVASRLLGNNLTATTPIGNFAKIIDKVVYDADTDMLKIDFKEKVNDRKVSDLVLTIGSTKYDVNKFLNKDAKEQTISDVTEDNFYGFPTVSKYSADGLKNEKLEEINIVSGGYSLTVADLYDGLFLTEKGQEFFEKIDARIAGADSATEHAVEIKDLASNTDIAYLTQNVSKELESNPTKYDAQISSGLTKHNGKYVVNVTFKAQAPNKVDEVYTITGTDKADITRLIQWMLKPQARVDVLAGDNRYETAVEIAKEYVGLKVDVPTNNTATNKIEDIVLVNGNALVDGLAASPLAAKKNAPVLLTEADALPKATKAYLKELMADQIVGANKTTIHLVGGEAVLSKSLERELRSYGFKIERYDGDNREETSLAVAEALGNTTKAFVVGAEGEADAMSIASVAAENTLPIIVAKKGGITEDAAYELKGKNVTIIGGENAVSKADEKTIKSEAKSVERVYGSNRQATNAEVIRKYYHKDFLTAKNVMVAKDGQNNKSELVDALAAANLAAQKDAPIVLATNKLSNAQINALELNAKNAFALYQIGNGVNRNVVKTIAENLGLSNR